jgi:hypothetical protein
MEVCHTPQEKFEDTKEVIRSHQSNKTDNTMAKRKRSKENDLQNTTQKTKDWATRTPLKTGDEHRCSGRLSSSCSTSGIRPVTVKRDTSLLLLISCRTTVYVNKYTL